MKTKILITLFTLVFFLIGCKKEQAPPFDKKELMRVKGNLLSPDFSNYLFISNKDGETLSCQKHSGSRWTTLSNEIPIEDDYFDFSIVTGINTAENSLRIETHLNIENKRWQFKNPFTNLKNESGGTVTFLADSLAENIDYAIINDLNWSLNSLEELKETGSFMRKFNKDERYIFFRFRMAGEEQYRYVEYKNLSDGDTITLDLASYPLGELENITSNGADNIKLMKLSGLRDSNNFENSTLLHSYGSFIQDYILPDGKAWYPTGIFDSFFTRILVEKDSFEYILEDTGPPVYSYNPTAPDLTIDGNQSNYRITSNSDDVDFVSATWVVDKPEGYIEWTVFHKKNETSYFGLPEIPDCLGIDLSWFASEDFKLKSITSHHYQNFQNYKAYIDSRYGQEIGGEGQRLILAGGRYEKKTIKK